jgi:hypothetical protein
MRDISLSRSLLVFADELEYTEAALLAEPATAELAPPVTLKLGQWDGVFSAWRSARREITRSNAVVAVVNAMLDEVTKLFGGEALVEAKQDRKSPLFRRFFPVAPSELIRWGFRDQVDATKNMIIVELRKLAEGNRLRAYIEPMTSLVTSATNAIERRSVVWGERSGVGLTTEDYKRGVNALRTTTYAELLKIAAANGWSKAWADSFFRKPSERGEGVTEEPEPVAPPA